MLPKSSKHFIQPTAEKLDYDTTLVEDVISFFYEDVRRALVDMRGPNIQIENLCSLTVRAKKVSGLIKKYEDHLKKLDPNNFSQKGIIISIEKQHAKVLNMSSMLDEEKGRRELHKIRVDEYRRKNMGESGQDS